MSEKDFVYADEKFADLQLLRYKLEGFESLTLQQKKYIFWAIFCLTIFRQKIFILRMRYLPTWNFLQEKGLTEMLK